MFAHSIVALVTPMDVDGAIAYDTLHRLINFHINAGTAALVCVGTTGESATLHQEEHLAVIKQCVAFAAGRIPIIAGSSMNATSDAIALTLQLEKIDLAGCLTVTPYYNKPTQEGLVRHFSAIAKSTHLPQILYNVPNRTGCDLLPETVARLAELPNIIGVKEASGDLSRVSRLRALTGDTFKLLSGDDATALDFMQLGGDGVISVTANVAAKSMALLAQQASAGHFGIARQLNQCLAPLHQALFTEPNPIPVKWAMQRIGLIANDTVRLPLIPLSSRAQQQVEQALYTAQLLS